MTEPLLSIRGLTTWFESSDRVVRAVNGVSYDVFPREVVGVVGESGSGKTVTLQAVMGLLPQPPARIVAGEAIFEGRDLLRMKGSELRRIRGGDVAMVFQDPSSYLNPVLTVGHQMAEAVRAHGDVSRAQARQRCVELLDAVGVPNAEARYYEYPFQLSGGMRQRVMIAMAMANRPKLLIADEPTTALDVTIQAQVLDVLQRAREESQAAIILVTHDLGLIAEMADRVVVMYAGSVVETGTVFDIFHRPRHPYTLGLLASVPRLDIEMNRLWAIDGSPPTSLPEGCAFHPRCSLGSGRQRCREEVPPLVELGPGRATACHFHDEMESEIDRLRGATGITLGQAES